MAFDVRWNSSGIDFNGAGLFITGDSPSFTIRWGEGPPEGVDADIDTDGDGVADSVDIFHFFGSDGNYDIAVDQFQNPGAPTFRLAAYMHTSETIVLGDADGDAIADFSIRIEGAGGITIAASDFLF